MRHCDNVSNASQLHTCTYAACLHTCHCVIAVYYPCVAIHVQHVNMLVYNAHYARAWLTDEHEVQHNTEKVCVGITLYI